MDVTCANCGNSFPARSAKARYCSDRCRKLKGKAEAVIELRPVGPVEPGPVATATERELRAVDRFETALGQACMTLANRLDHPGLDTGSAVAAVAARLETMLLSATKGTAKPTAPQQLRDQLAERRAKHGA